MRWILTVSTLALGAMLTACSAEPATAPETSSATFPAPSQSDEIPAYRLRLPEDEIVYFMLPDRFANADPENDRGGIEGGRLDHGFDPTHKGFYHGGDLKGLTEKLDYIQGMGATAIWLGPIYKNKPVQGGEGHESSGYHGYWITDFTTVDPHLGTEDELKTFIDAAHERGIKVYLDIITNHTADVISYRECHDPDFKGAKADPSCPYRSRADYPYSTLGNAKGPRINKGFMGDEADHQTPENFAKLTNPNYAYTPFIPEGEENVKVPAWLNDITLYHNRGNTTFEGENSIYGDFVGLDDLFTAHPTVVKGFIEIYSDWITTYKVDGFRIDTARHVNAEFWQQFLPAILDHAHQEGIPNFYIFGEVSYTDPGDLARYTRVDEFPLVLDFAFQSAMYDVIAKNAAPDRLSPLFRADDLYEGGAARARQLPTFLGNHDFGRIAHFIVDNNPDASEDEVLARLKLAHAIMFFARGVPVIYYGDEQGFIGDGHDQDSRETMFPSQVASYADNNLIGTDKSSAEDNFDTDHPLYQTFSSFAEAYHTHPALRRGVQKVRRADLGGPGAFALSRFDPENGKEYLFVANTSAQAMDINIEVDMTSTDWQSVIGQCHEAATAPGSYAVSLPAFGYAVCRAR